MQDNEDLPPTKPPTCFPTTPGALLGQTHLLETAKAVPQESDAPVEDNVVHMILGSENNSRSAMSWASLPIAAATFLRGIGFKQVTGHRIRRPPVKTMNSCSQKRSSYCLLGILKVTGSTRLQSLDVRSIIVFNSTPSGNRLVGLQHHPPQLRSAAFVGGYSDAALPYLNGLHNRMGIKFAPEDP
eukprot:scaffold285262_cov18-Tisochrysis_lutea.AAC.1